MENGARVLVRPSGTEPKLKIYVDLPIDLTLDYASTKADGLERAGVLAGQTTRAVSRGAGNDER